MSVAFWIGAALVAVGVLFLALTLQGKLGVFLLALFGGKL